MKGPDVRRVIAVCMSCHHWQVDVRQGAVSDLGGSIPALTAMAAANADHLNDCPGAGGRIRFGDQWVDPPKMQDGNPATGTMALHPMPAWWVTK